MSRAIAWQRQAGGAHGHVFVWPALGVAGAPPSPGTGRHRPWLLYGRKGGTHGQLFVWPTLGSAGAAPSAADSPYIPVYRRRRR